MLAFTSVYFLGISLFNGLRPFEINNSGLPFFPFRKVSGKPLGQSISPVCASTALGVSGE
jgi:hypothetical protein